MGEIIEEIKHDVFIKSRKQLEMSGVVDVSSFDEHEILIQIGTQGASIEGEGLKIERFSAQSGELVVNGKINGIYYFNKEPIKKKKGLANIFK